MGNILSRKSLVIIFMMNIEANEIENLFDRTLKNIRTKSFLLIKQMIGFRF